MTLISLLLVLAIERITTKTQYWQIEFYFQRYQRLIAGKNWLTEQSSSWNLFILIALPPLLLALLLHNLDGGIIAFMLNTAILMVCLGSPAIRAVYKCYLQAANRGDLEACDLYARELGGEEQGLSTFAATLVWKNYQYYAAVVTYFVAFGSVGALFYTLGRNFAEHLQRQQHRLAPQGQNLMALADWLPVRLSALGLMLVGHYSRALPLWLGYLPDTTVSARVLLTQVSRAAEDVEPDSNDCTEEPCTLVRLAKRNMMFLLVGVAILTLTDVIN